MFLLDTEVLSALAKRRRDVHVERWLATRRDDELFLSVVSVGEIERGIAMQRDRDDAFAERLATWLDRLLAGYAERVLPFDLAAARRWGELSARIGPGGGDLQYRRDGVGARPDGGDAQRRPFRADRRGGGQSVRGDGGLKGDARPLAGSCNRRRSGVDRSNSNRTISNGR